MAVEVARPPRRGSVWPLIALLALPVAALAFLAYQKSKPDGAAPGAASLTSHSRVVQVGAPPTEIGGRQSPGSLFTERISASATPTIHVTNREDDVITCVFRDPAGHEFRVQSSAGKTESIRIPPGQYTVEVSSNDPFVQPNSGDATFRRFKDYDADFVHASSAESFHLGD